MDFKIKERVFAEHFFKPTFNIDEFLSQCTLKSDLLTVRKDLKEYGSKLYAIMVDILKTETEGIINLAENLTHLNITIEELCSPISQLCEEIRTLYHAINTANIDFRKYLDKVETMTWEKNCLNLKIGIYATSSYINNIMSSWENEADITTLERAVNEYSFQYLYLSALGLESVVLESDTQKIAVRLLDLVDEVFLTALKERNEEKIVRSLRMYMNLVKQEEADKCLRKHVVEPGLRSIFTQRNLDCHGQDINVLYKMALQFLNDEFDLLLGILQRNLDLRGFNFVANCFWVEVDKQICHNLPNITAPGNPELFQKRFKDTWNFLQEIANLSGDVTSFKTNPSYKRHMERFNLPVYFEIVFQQMSVKFEMVMLIEPSSFNEAEWKSLVSDDKGFNLKITESLWKGIKQCFDNSVFLNHIVDQFLKLMMLLVSRYIKWFDTFLMKWDESSNWNADELEKFVVYSMMDIKEMQKRLDPLDNIDDYDKTIFKVVSNLIRPSLSKILVINIEILRSLYIKLEKQLIHFKVQQSSTYLQQVTSIPRLYRRTNRDVPQKPSKYVLDTVSPVVKFHSNFQPIMQADITTVLDCIVTELGEQYLALVQEVLHSVCKTEESLRRLKNRSLNVMDESVAQTSRDATSDEAKIREQIKIDAGYFIKELSPFSVELNKQVLQNLIKESSQLDRK